MKRLATLNSFLLFPIAAVCLLQASDTDCFRTICMSREASAITPIIRGIVRGFFFFFALPVLLGRGRDVGILGCLLARRQVMGQSNNRYCVARERSVTKKGPSVKPKHAN